MSETKDERRLEELLERIRWNGVIASPFDPNSRVYKCSHHKYRCKNTGKYFNVRTHTIFHNTKISLRQWMAILSYYDHNRDMSPHMIARYGNTSLKSAYHISKRLKKFYNEECRNTNEIEVEVELDRLKLAEWIQMLRHD